MIVTIDLNVILDMFLKRGEYAASLELLTLCKDGKLKGNIPSHGLPTIYYVIRKQKGHEEAIWAIKYLLEFLDVFPVGLETMRRASIANFGDFEDAIVAQAAEESGSSYIVTSNTKDFLKSNVLAISPELFLKRFFG
jgi:predicted nucleic acid-binding protein